MEVLKLLDLPTSGLQIAVLQEEDQVIRMGKKDIPVFVDSIPDAKLCDWSQREYTVYEDRKLGYRLDHQGVSQFPGVVFKDSVNELIYQTDEQGWDPPNLHPAYHRR